MKRSYIQRKPTKEKKPTLNHPSLPHSKPAKPAKPSKPKTRTKIKAVSSKRAGWLREYEAEKKRRGNGPHPCWVCGKPAIVGEDADFHHPSGRRTKEALLTFHPVHKHEHNWIHSHPGEALKRGWLTTEFFRSTK